MPIELVIFFLERQCPFNKHLILLMEDPSFFARSRIKIIGYYAINLIKGTLSLKKKYYQLYPHIYQ